MSAPTKVATFVRVVPGFIGDARLYRLNPPMPTYDPDNEWETPSEPAEYVVVSGTVVMYSGRETYIFAANADGRIVDWSELDGSFRGGIDHERALRGAGYTVVQAAEIGA